MDKQNEGLKTQEFCKLGCLVQRNMKNTGFLTDMVKSKSSNMREYN
jgi:hypothetical protein